MFKRIISLIILSNFLLTSVLPNPSYAQSLNLPAPGALVETSGTYVPVILKGLSVKPENPLLFDFIVDTGNTGYKPGTGDDAAIKAESEKLVKYFLASLTLPEKDQWVNLSPYEKDQMMSEELAKTELGRDMLGQDYLLKQVTASLMYPESKLGKEFWGKVYAQAEEKFGTTDIPVDTFNKVWVVADKANVYVNKNTAFVVGSHLKVMLESDYLAADEQKAGTEQQELAKQIVREIILPALEIEVNTGKNFAGLRQIFHSMILATWYKKSLKEALLTQVYADKNKVTGVELAKGEDQDPQAIYARYVEAYKKGVFNFIKEETTADGETMPKKYFSGGIPAIFNMDQAMQILDNAQAEEVRDFNIDNAMRVNVQLTTPDAAMKAGEKKLRLQKEYLSNALSSLRSKRFVGAQNWLLAIKTEETQALAVQLNGRPAPGTVDRVIKSVDGMVRAIDFLTNGSDAAMASSAFQSPVENQTMAPRLVNDLQRRLGGEFTNNGDYIAIPNGQNVQKYHVDQIYNTALEMSGGLSKGILKGKNLRVDLVFDWDVSQDMAGILINSFIKEKRIMGLSGTVTASDFTLNYAGSRDWLLTYADLFGRWLNKNADDVMKLKSLLEENRSNALSAIKSTDWQINTTNFAYDAAMAAVGDWEEARGGVVDRFGWIRQLNREEVNDQISRAFLQTGPVDKRVFSTAEVFNVVFRLSSGVKEAAQNGRLIYDVFVSPLGTSEPVQSDFYQGYVTANFKDGKLESWGELFINDRRLEQLPWLKSFLDQKLTELKGQSFLRGDTAFDAAMVDIVRESRLARIQQKWYGFDQVKTALKSWSVTVVDPWTGPDNVGITAGWSKTMGADQVTQEILNGIVSAYLEATPQVANRFGFSDGAFSFKGERKSNVEVHAEFSRLEQVLNEYAASLGRKLDAAMASESSSTGELGILTGLLGRARQLSGANFDRSGEMAKHVQQKYLPDIRQLLFSLGMRSGTAQDLAATEGLTLETVEGRLAQIRAELDAAMSDRVRESAYLEAESILIQLMFPKIPWLPENYPFTGEQSLRDRARMLLKENVRSASAGVLAQLMDTMTEFDTSESRQGVQGWLREIREEVFANQRRSHPAEAFNKEIMAFQATRDLLDQARDMNNPVTRAELITSAREQLRIIKNNVAEALGEDLKAHNGAVNWLHVDTGLVHISEAIHRIHRAALRRSHDGAMAAATGGQLEASVKMPVADIKEYLYKLPGLDWTKVRGGSLVMQKPSGDQWITSVRSWRIGNLENIQALLRNFFGTEEPGKLEAGISVIADEVVIRVKSDAAMSDLDIPPQLSSALAVHVPTPESLKMIDRAMGGANLAINFLLLLAGTSTMAVIWNQVAEGAEDSGAVNKGTIRLGTRRVIAQWADGLLNALHLDLELDRSPSGEELPLYMLQNSLPPTNAPYSRYRLLLTRDIIIDALEASLKQRDLAVTFSGRSSDMPVVMSWQGEKAPVIQAVRAWVEGQAVAARAAWRDAAMAEGPRENVQNLTDDDNGPRVLKSVFDGTRTTHVMPPLNMHDRHEEGFTFVEDGDTLNDRPYKIKQRYLASLTSKPDAAMAEPFGKPGAMVSSGVINRFGQLLLVDEFLGTVAVPPAEKNARTKLRIASVSQGDDQYYFGQIQHPDETYPSRLLVFLGTDLGKAKDILINVMGATIKAREPLGQQAEILNAIAAAARPDAAMTVLDHVEAGANFVFAADQLPARLKTTAGQEFRLVRFGHSVAAINMKGNYEGVVEPGATGPIVKTFELAYSLDGNEVTVRNISSQPFELTTDAAMAGKGLSRTIADTVMGWTGAAAYMLMSDAMRDSLKATQFAEDMLLQSEFEPRIRSGSVLIGENGIPAMWRFSPGLCQYFVDKALRRLEARYKVSFQDMTDYKKSLWHQTAFGSWSMGKPFRVSFVRTTKGKGQFFILDTKDIKFERLLSSLVPDAAMGVDDQSKMYQGTLQSLLEGVQNGAIIEDFSDGEEYQYIRFVNGLEIEAIAKSDGGTMFSFLRPFDGMTAQRILHFSDKLRFDAQNQKGKPIQSGDAALFDKFISVESGSDSAMTPGGIDLNAQNMTLDEQGQKIDIQFDPAMIEQFKKGDFTGLTPVILNMTPIANVRPLLGLAPETIGGPTAGAAGVSTAARREDEV